MRNAVSRMFLPLRSKAAKDLLRPDCPGGQESGAPVSAESMVGLVYTIAWVIYLVLQRA